MENATDALLMAFAVLVFVIALSVSIFAFSNVTSASQAIIDARDKTSMYTYVETEGISRKVTAEDIIPTLYRAYYENYMVRFEGIGNLFEVKNEGPDKEVNPYIPTNIIDLEGQKIGNHEDANKLIDALLKGNLNELFADRRGFDYFNNNPTNTLLSKGLYDIIIENNEFKEEIGLYYMEDRTDNTSVTDTTGVEDVNKNKKRIITYTYPYS